MAEKYRNTYIAENYDSIEIPPQIWGLEPWTALRKCQQLNVPAIYNQKW